MRVRVTFDVDVPDEVQATDEEIEEWLRFNLNDNGSMSNKNPLATREVTPVFPSFEWEKV